MILTFKTRDIVQILERHGVELHEAEINTLDHMILDLNMLIEEEMKSRENPDIEELVLDLYRRHVASLPYYVTSDYPYLIFRWKEYKPTPDEKEILDFIENNPDVVIGIACKDRYTPFIRLSQGGGDEDAVFVFLEGNEPLFLEGTHIYRAHYHMIEYNDKTYIVKIDYHA